jgi:hypothetical protein
LDAQINLLLDSRAVVIKSVSLNEKSDTVTITQPDSTTLANELGLFRKIFNNRTFKTENGPDLKSNLTVRTYRVEIDSSREQSWDKSIRIFFYNTPANLRKIEVHYNEGNLMFNSSKRLTMAFESIYNKVTLVNYAISGKQKMLLGDSVSFDIRGDFKIK